MIQREKESGRINNTKSIGKIHNEILFYKLKNKHITNMYIHIYTHLYTYISTQYVYIYTYKYISMHTLMHIYTHI